LHAALPFVETADSVVLLRGEGREAWPSITKAPKLDIVDYLTRHARQVDHAGHGVVDSSAAEIILDSARAFGCDMIVMGAFGREGLARMLFGGATSHVLARASVPVLAAH
jgi:nucleotide-binding universal stress UspA family protein